MGEVVNLKNARKARRREAKAVEAESNRTRHGRTAAERERERLQCERAKRLLDGSQREDA